VPELRRSRTHPAGSDLPAQPATGPAGCMSSFTARVLLAASQAGVSMDKVK
jgi:hypothetical protein